MRVINDPPAPVLAIRYGIPKRRGFRRIVVPVHLQQTSGAAADLAAAIARNEGGEIHLLILCKKKEMNAAQARLDEVARSIEGIEVHRVVLEADDDDVDKEIVRYAGESNADAVFLNSHGEIGEVKREIIRHVATRVMIVPSQQTA